MIAVPGFFFFFFIEGAFASSPQLLPLDDELLNYSHQNETEHLLAEHLLADPLLRSAKVSFQTCKVSDNKFFFSFLSAKAKEKREKNIWRAKTNVKKRKRMQKTHGYLFSFQKVPTIAFLECRTYWGEETEETSVFVYLEFVGCLPEENKSKKVKKVKVMFQTEKEEKEEKELMLTCIEHLRSIWVIWVIWVFEHFEHSGHLYFISRISSFFSSNIPNWSTRPQPDHRMRKWIVCLLRETFFQ